MCAFEEIVKTISCLNSSLSEIYSCSPIKTACVHLLGEASVLIHILAKLRPSIGRKMTENAGFPPFSEKVFSQSNSNLMCTLIVFGSVQLSCQSVQN